MYEMNEWEETIFVFQNKKNEKKNLELYFILMKLRMHRFRHETFSLFSENEGIICRLFIREKNLLTIGVPTW